MTVTLDSTSEEWSSNFSSVVRSRYPIQRSAFLFGHHISHSLSPILHNVVFDQLYNYTLDTFSYTLLDTLDTEAFRQALMEDTSCVGASITMPHKLSAMRFVDELSEHARIIGAINTVYFRKDRRDGADDSFHNGSKLSNRRYVLGTNTDCIGIRDALVRKFSDHSIIEKVQGKLALVIGAGGTARAAVYSLWKFFQVDEIYVVNRLQEEVAQMIKSMSTNGCDVKIRWVAEAVDVKRPWVVVGTVPDIRAVTPEETRAEETVKALLKLKKPQEDGWLLDMCYYPEPETRLMKTAERLGWKTVSGVDAMCYGNIAQDRLWTDKAISNEVIGKGHAAVWKEVTKSRV